MRATGPARVARQRVHRSVLAVLVTGALAAVALPATPAAAATPRLGAASPGVRLVVQTAPGAAVVVTSAARSYGAGKRRRPRDARHRRAMTEHTKTDGLPDVLTLPDAASGLAPQVLDKSRPRSERMAATKIECNACPVLCQISPGKTGACDRYAERRCR